MTIIVGLTGGIASGKTTLSNFLKNKKFAVHDSDLVVKKIYSRPSPFFLKHLKKLGLSHSIKNNKINKNTIRDEVFNNKKTKKKLEEYIHSEVKKERNQFINNHKKNKTKILFLDIPLLFEAKLVSICDYVILLYAPKKTKIQRAMSRKGMKKNILLKILESQISDKIKKRKSDFIINTSKPKKHSFEMILKAINNIMSLNA